jgi:hypothetical protein
MSQGPFQSRTRVLFSRHACPVNMTHLKHVSDTCPTVWCPTRRIRDTRGGLDVSGDLVCNLCFQDLKFPDPSSLSSTLILVAILSCGRNPSPLGYRNNRKIKFLRSEN